MMETKWNTAPIENAASATRNRFSRRRTRVRMACRRPSEYSAAATRSQMTLISAIGNPVKKRFEDQYNGSPGGGPITAFPGGFAREGKAAGNEDPIHE